MAVVLNSLSWNGHSSRINKVISRIFREPHVYLSQGSHVKTCCYFFCQKNTFAGSDVETRRPWQLKTLTWTFRTSPSCIGWVLTGWVGYGMVWWCMFFWVITASATIKWEPITLEICGFPKYMVSIEWKPMMLYVAVTQQVNITSCSDPPQKIYKMGDYTRALKMRDKMCIKKCSYPGHIPPHFIEEIPKGILGLCIVLWTPP